MKDLAIVGDDGPTPEPKDEMRLPPQDDDGGGEGDGGGMSFETDGDDDFEAEPAGTPFPNMERPPPLSPALIPSPAQPKGRPRKNTAPAGARLHKSLAEKVPHADKVKVYKRIDGRRFFVGDYSRNDLQQFTDFESFLARYVKSVHGAGEYDLVGVDGLSRETELGQIRFLPDPTKQTPEASAIGLVERVMHEQRERDEEWRKTASANQLNPLELLTGVMTLKTQLDGEAGGGMAAAMKAMSESSQQTTQLMLAMMQQNQQTMMALLTKPKEEDQTLKLLLTKLLSDQSGGGGAALPPPPPPPSPTAGLAEVLTAMAAFMGAMGGGGGGDDEFKEFLKTLLPTLLNKNDGLGTKEVLELVLGNKKSGGDEFRSAIDNMAAIMNVAQNINRGGEPGSAAGFFDALAALFSNRDFAGSIAQTIRAKTSVKTDTDEQRIAAEKQRLAMERRLLQQERSRLAASGSAPPPPRPTPQVSPEEVQQAAQKTVQRTGRIPELPGNTYEHINSILGAKDEGEQVGRTIAMLIYFAEFEDWRQFSERLLTLVRDGNKTEAMRYLTAFFEGLAAIGMLPNEEVLKITSVLARHFTTVQEQLTELSTEADKQVTGEQLVEPPPEAAAAGAV